MIAITKQAFQSIQNEEFKFTLMNKECTRAVWVHVCVCIYTTVGDSEERVTHQVMIHVYMCVVVMIQMYAYVN